MPKLRLPDEEVWGRGENRLRAWGVMHDSHGLCVDTIVILPEGEKPETDARWVRLPWLDQPAVQDHGYPVHPDVSKARAVAGIKDHILSEGEMRAARQVVDAGDGVGRSIADLQRLLGETQGWLDETVATIHSIEEALGIRPGTSLKGTLAPAVAHARKKADLVEELQRQLAVAEQGRARNHHALDLARAAGVPLRTDCNRVDDAMEDLLKAFRNQNELIEAAWRLIANAGGGNWMEESDAWIASARRWRDAYEGTQPLAPTHSIDFYKAVRDSGFRLADKEAVEVQTCTHCGVAWGWIASVNMADHTDCPTCGARYEEKDNG